MARSHQALKDFLQQHAKVKPAAVGPNGTEEDCYVIKTDDCLFFMAESHLREINIAINGMQGSAAGLQPINYAKFVIAHSWDAPERGYDRIRIPVKWVESLDAKQALLLVRHLEGIQKDINEGKRCKEVLQELFADTATIKSSTTLNGERIFKIAGKLSADDRRRYVERYAEQVATNTLFDIAKALNGQLQQLLPDIPYGKPFIEGRDLSDRKIRYGSEVNTELELSDDGAWFCTSHALSDAKVKAAMEKIFRQAITDPFGLSLKHYMGKHNVLKAGKRPLVKLPNVWLRLKSYFKRKPQDSK